MGLRDDLAKIGNGYELAKSQPFTGHPLAHLLRSGVSNSIRVAIGPQIRDMKLKGSAGQGQWTAVPWIVAMNEVVTGSPMRGYYVVYLFDTEAERVSLSLNQGTTSIRKLFGANAREVLAERAAIMRSKLSDYRSRFPVTDIGLDEGRTLSGDYAAGHVLGLTYDIGSLPPENILLTDLADILTAYRKLIFRGGADFTDEEEHKEGDAQSVIEVRRYRLHRRIDRDQSASRKAKQHHGFVCQACGFDFETHYGELGRDYIEAHHLRPLSDLEEGKPITFDVKTDFAVLCANCHRMIHKMEDVSDLGGLRTALMAARKSPAAVKS